MNVKNWTWPLYYSQEGKPMINYLTYYYKHGTEPFQSLSALPDEEVIKIMEELSDDTVFGARFKNPIQYMHNRRQTEQWVREEFMTKGGGDLRRFIRSQWCLGRPNGW